MLEEVRCYFCNKKFTKRYLHLGLYNYCSPECRQAGMKTEKRARSDKKAKERRIKNKVTKFIEIEKKHKKLIAKKILYKSYPYQKISELELIDMFGGKCTNCGYDKYKIILRFHHINEETKYFKICDRIKTSRRELIIEEAKKCILLCPTCHAEYHIKEYDNNISDQDLFIDDYNFVYYTDPCRRIVCPVCKQTRNGCHDGICRKCFYMRERIDLINRCGGKCNNCGYDRKLRLLVFHHIDPETKEFDIAQKAICKNKTKVYEELKKCVLLCQTCHREEHIKIRDQRKASMV